MALLALFIVSVVPIKSEASWFYCPVINDPGQRQQHGKWGDKAEDWISTLLEEQYYEYTKGEDAESAQKLITSAYSESSKAFITAVSAAWKQHAITLAVHDNQMDFSQDAKAPGACFTEDETVKTSSGTIYINKYQNKANDTVRGYALQDADTRSTSKLYKSLADPADHEIVDSSRFFPAQNNITEEEANNLLETIVLATDPFIVPILTDSDQKEISAGLEYEANKQYKDINVSMSQQALIEIISKKIAAYDMADWAEKVSPVIASTVTTDKLSADQLLDFQVAVRYSDPNWTTNVGELTHTGVYRELASMNAVSLEFSRRVLRHAEKEIALMASSESLEANKAVMPLINKLNALKGE